MQTFYTLSRNLGALPYIEPAGQLMSASIHKSPLATARAGNQSTAHPRSLRVFVASVVIAVLCGGASLMTANPKGLSPAPFIAMGALAAFTGCAALASMLLCTAFDKLMLLRRGVHE